MEIVDSHIHMWDTSLLSFPWLTDIPPLNTPYLPSHFQQQTKELQNTLKKLVFVQCEAIPKDGLRELDFVQQILVQEPRIQAIVAWAPVEVNYFEDYLQEITQRPLVKGIRRVLQNEGDLFCLSNDFIRGMRTLSKYNLPFDICCKPEQLPAVIELVKMFPNIKFVLDHCGKPDVKNRRLSPWKDHIAILGGFTNVYCKLSGLVTEADWRQWTKSQVVPYLLMALDAFGLDRVMFGGDWPICTVACKYSEWVQIVKEVIPQDPESQRKVFYQNACNFYNLDTPSSY